MNDFLIQKLGQEATFDLGEGGRIRVSAIASGEVEIYTPDGELSIMSRSSNSIRIHCLPMWDDKTMEKITQHIIENTTDPKQAAGEIIRVIRGRSNKNKRLTRKDIFDVD